MIEVNLKRKIKKATEGITLIALVITVIVLLILAGVTVATLTGDNGILTKVTEAKNKNEEAEEKEKVELSAVGALAKDNGGEIKEGYLDEELASHFGERGTDYELEGSGPYTVTILESGRRYVIDADGTIGEAVKREGIKVGDYVNYTPEVEETTYGVEKLGPDITGASDNKSAITQDSMKWKILNIDASGRVDLISESPTSQNVYFYGALGYNNGVYVINDICRELYSNKSLRIEARNLNIEDIENQMNEKGVAERDAYSYASGLPTYGNTRKYTENKQYPILYAQENGSGINTEEVKTDGIDVNADGYNSPTTQTSNIAEEKLTVTQTYYHFDSTLSSYFDNSGVHEMIFGTGTDYWLASRYALCFFQDAAFGIHCVKNSNLSKNHVFYTTSRGDNNYSFLRPIVSLGSDIQITPVENADGSSTTNMHQISKQKSEI